VPAPLPLLEVIVVEVTVLSLVLPAAGVPDVVAATLLVVELALSSVVPDAVLDDEDAGSVSVVEVAAVDSALLPSCEEVRVQPISPSAEISASASDQGPKFVCAPYAAPPRPLTVPLRQERQTECLSRQIGREHRSGSMGRGADAVGNLFGAPER
jgi:hypothetical protein